MFAKKVFFGLLAFAAPFLVRADVTPTGPAPGASFNAGSTCAIAWNGDTNSTTVWKGMAIELMTGDNFDMIHLTTVTTNQDGTVSGRFTYTCPQVTPNSAIYFYQFSSPQTSTLTWTGRFTIASSDGKSTPPTNATQPGTHEQIPWGKGSLVDPSQAVAAPSFVSSGSSSTLPITSSLAANSSTLAATTSGTGATISSAPVLTGTATVAVTGTRPDSTPALSTSSAGPTTQSNGQTSGARGGGAVTGFDVRVLGAAAVATLALSFVW